MHRPVEATQHTHTLYSYFTVFTLLLRGIFLKHNVKGRVMFHQLLQDQPTTWRHWYIFCKKVQRSLIQWLKKQTNKKANNKKKHWSNVIPLILSVQFVELVTWDQCLAEKKMKKMCELDVLKNYTAVNTLCNSYAKYHNEHGNTITRHYLFSM